jgi:hypothetical protein
MDKLTNMYLFCQREKKQNLQAALALARALAILPELSPTGLATVKQACEAMVLPAGLNARMASQAALRERNGVVARPLGAGGASAKDKARADGTTKKKTEKGAKTLWRQLSCEERDKLAALPGFASIQSEQSKLHGQISKKEKAGSSPCLRRSTPPWRMGPSGLH